jgi:pyrophosphatase PpaX
MSASPFDVVIFDFDGTIGDTLPLIYEAFDAALRPEINRRMEDHEIRSLFGPPDNAIIRSIVEDEAAADQAIERYVQAYEDGHQELASLFDGIETILASAKESGVRLGIVTGKSRVTAIHSLTAFGVIEYFDAIYAGDDVERQKPHPEAIFAILRDLEHGKGERAVIVGDSAADVEAGKAAGIETIGVTWGSPDHDELYQSEPDLVIHTAAELAQALGIERYAEPAVDPTNRVRD